MISSAILKDLLFGREAGQKRDGEFEAEAWKQSIVKQEVGGTGFLTQKAHLFGEKQQQKRKRKKKPKFARRSFLTTADLEAAEDTLLIHNNRLDYATQLHVPRIDVEILDRQYQYTHHLAVESIAKMKAAREQLLGDTWTISKSELELLLEFASLDSDLSASFFLSPPTVDDHTTSISLKRVLNAIQSRLLKVKLVSLVGERLGGFQDWSLLYLHHNNNTATAQQYTRSHNNSSTTGNSFLQNSFSLSRLEQLVEADNNNNQEEENETAVLKSRVLPTYNKNPKVLKFDKSLPSLSLKEKGGFDDSYSRPTPRVLHNTLHANSNNPPNMKRLREELLLSQQGIVQLNKLVDTNIAWVQSNLDLTQYSSHLSQRTKQKCRLMAAQKLIDTLHKAQHRGMFYIWQRWKNVVIEQQAVDIVSKYSLARSLHGFITIITRIYLKLTFKRLATWLKQVRLMIAMEKEAAAIEIQRVVRSILTLRKIQNTKLDQFAVKIQGLFRSKHAQIVTANKRVARQLEVQITAKELLKEYFQNINKIKAAKAELQRRKDIKAAKQIQKIIRGKQGRQLYLDKKDKLATEREERQRQLLLTNSKSPPPKSPMVVPRLVPSGGDLEAIANEVQSPPPPTSAAVHQQESESSRSSLSTHSQSANQAAKSTVNKLYPPPAAAAVSASKKHQQKQQQLSARNKSIAASASASAGVKGGRSKVALVKNIPVVSATVQQRAVSVVQPAAETEQLQQQQSQQQWIEKDTGRPNSASSDYGMITPSPSKVQSARRGSSRDPSPVNTARSGSAQQRQLSARSSRPSSAAVVAADADSTTAGNRPNPLSFQPQLLSRLAEVNSPSNSSMDTGRSEEDAIVRIQKVARGRLGRVDSMKKKQQAATVMTQPLPSQQAAATSTAEPPVAAAGLGGDAAIVKIQKIARGKLARVASARLQVESSTTTDAADKNNDNAALAPPDSAVNRTRVSTSASQASSSSASAAAAQQPAAAGIDSMMLVDISEASQLIAKINKGKAAGSKHTRMTLINNTNNNKKAVKVKDSDIVKIQKIARGKLARQQSKKLIEEKQSSAAKIVVTDSQDDGDEEKGSDDGSKVENWPFFTQEGGEQLSYGEKQQLYAASLSNRVGKKDRDSESEGILKQQQEASELESEQVKILPEEPRPKSPPSAILPAVIPQSAPRSPIIQPEQVQQSSPEKKTGGIIASSIKGLFSSFSSAMVRGRSPSPQRPSSSSSNVSSNNDNNQRRSVSPLKMISSFLSGKGGSRSRSSSNAAGTDDIQQPVAAATANLTLVPAVIKEEEEQGEQDGMIANDEDQNQQEEREAMNAIDAAPTASPNDNEQQQVELDLEGEQQVEVGHETNSPVDGAAATVEEEETNNTSQQQQQQSPSPPSANNINKVDTSIQSQGSNSPKKKSVRSQSPPPSSATANRGNARKVSISAASSSKKAITTAAAPTNNSSKAKKQPAKPVTTPAVVVSLIPKERNGRNEGIIRAHILSLSQEDPNTTLAIQKLFFLAHFIFNFHTIQRKRLVVQKQQTHAGLLLQFYIVEIQRIIRGKLGKLKFHRCKVAFSQRKVQLQHEKVKKIQAIIRGRFGRKKVSQIREKRAVMKQEKLWLQSFQNSRTARQKQLSQQRLEAWELEQEELNVPDRLMPEYTKPLTQPQTQTLTQNTQSNVPNPDTQNVGTSQVQGIDEKLLQLQQLELRIQEEAKKAELRLQSQLELFEEKQRKAEADRLAREQLLEMAMGTGRSPFMTNQGTRMMMSTQQQQQQQMLLTQRPSASARSAMNTFLYTTSGPPTGRSAREGLIPKDAPKLLYKDKEWVQLWDYDQNAYYWWNDKDQMAQWEQPGMETYDPNAGYYTNGGTFNPLQTATTPVKEENEEDDTYTESGYESSGGALTDFSSDHHLYPYSGGYGGEEESLATEWQEYWDEQAQAKYWYNNYTGEASWTMPETLLTITDPTANNGQGAVSTGTTAATLAIENGPVSASSTAGQSGKNGRGWVSYLDEATGQLYWHNVNTGEVKWDV